MFVCFDPAVTIERRPKAVSVRLQTRQIVVTRALGIVSAFLHSLQTPLTEPELADLITRDRQYLQHLLDIFQREKLLIRLPVSSREAAAFLARRHRPNAPVPELRVTANSARLTSEPVDSGASTFENLLSQRYSASRPGHTPVSQDSVGRLLRVSYGQAGPSGTGTRPTPAAGGMPALKAFLHYDIDGQLNTWIYNSDHNVLQGVSSAHVSIRELCNDQDTVDLARALVTFVYVRNANWSRYAARGLDFALIEAGHAAQNLTLAATEAGIASRCMGSLSDARFRQVCVLAPDELPVYAVAMF